MGIAYGQMPESSSTESTDHDVTSERARPVRSRFELAIRRMMDAWLDAGRMEVSSGDVRLAREFLEMSGCKVEETADARLRVVGPEGRTQEMTREGAVVAALRRLAERRS
jgi:hypothetical protein